VTALSEYGQPVVLPECGGWVLQRSIPGYTAFDAMGCYPIFACKEWPSLHLDLEQMGGEWVCLSLIADPFGGYSQDYLRTCFPNLMVPFKNHFIVDLQKAPRDYIDAHHSRNARKALKDVTVEPVQDHLHLLDEWMALYNVLIERHHIIGMTAFSRRSFGQQLQVPGLMAFRAKSAGMTIGLLLWYVMDNVAYYHLGAYSELGYELRASFALFSLAISYFSDMRIEWLSLGAGAGTRESVDDGLSRFKRGWSNGVRTAYLCGRVFDHARYLEIIHSKPISAESDYFPLYRKGEF